MPISSTVAPTTETITRLTILIFSRFQTLKRRFIHDGSVFGPFHYESAASSHRPSPVNWIDIN
jgi:hypothetical protein